MTAPGSVDRDAVPAAAPAQAAALSLSAETHGDTVVVVVRGPLDIYTAPDFRTAVAPVARPGARVVVDLSDVTILDSCGLGALLWARNRVQEGAPRFGLVCPHRRIRRILDITGLLDAFVVGHDLAAVTRAWDVAGDRTAAAR